VGGMCNKMSNYQMDSTTTVEQPVATTAASQQSPTATHSFTCIARFKKMLDCYWLVQKGKNYFLTFSRLFSIENLAFVEVELRYIIL